MLTGRKYRLVLTSAQAEKCQEFGDVCRAVFNTALDQRRQAIQRWQRGFTTPFCGYHLQAAQLAEAKQDEPWLRAAPSHILQQTLKDLDVACRTRSTFRVRWRAKRRWAPSFRFPDAKQIIVERLNRRWGRVRLPKLGWVTFRRSRPLGGTVRSATVSYRSGHWYISFLVEDGLLTPEQHPHPSSAVGVDRGVAVAATTSDGTFYDRKFATPGEKARYRRLQQKLARQKKSSANRVKTRTCLGYIATRAVNRRADFYAWVANRLTRDNATVALEDLTIRNMTASARGTVEIPGTQVTQKSGLNRAILDKGWHRFETALHNAARRTGSRIIKVNPAYTSQTCHECQHTDPKSRESQAAFRCTRCRHACHADVNAAKNHLRAAGHAVPACEDLSQTSVKQEPARTREEVPHQPALLLVGIPRH